jgi:hypothetical protein
VFIFDDILLSLGAEGAFIDAAASGLWHNNDEEIS